MIGVGSHNLCLGVSFNHIACHLTVHDARLLFSSVQDGTCHMQVQHRTGISMDGFRVLFEGERMDPDNTLELHTIEPGDKIDYVFVQL